MALQLGDTAPDFEADTTEGRIKFHDWIGDSWAVLFSHPKDFTPVCTTELGYMAKAKPEFEARDVKIIGLSVDPLDKHEQWAKDIEETQGAAPNYPIVSDADFAVSKLYGMLPSDVSGSPDERTPADNQTVRNVFVIGPDKKVKLILIYPMTTGRNFDEVLRVIDSLQLTAKHKVATPVNWKEGEPVIIAGSVSNEQAREIYPDGWEEPRPYIRIVPQPSWADGSRRCRALRPAAAGPPSPPLRAGTRPAPTASSWTRTRPSTATTSQDARRASSDRCP
jgi:thioredoxin-dependent peroxiredoxin